jgi:nitrogen-specific signal transduction histidine kinase/ActR/RegA family two-component response regulator
MIVCEDVTARKEAEAQRARLEAELRQAQKMEALGRLAGGVAHDFNNLLTAITGYSDLLLAALSDDDPLRRDADEIRKASERATSLTRQLLAFSRQQPLNPVALDLNEVVTEMEMLLRRLIGEDVELVTMLAPGLPPVFADRGQLEQVIVNLAVNARDAMPEGGTLVIETDAGRVPTGRGDRVREVALSVTDTGIGMDEAVRSRIFEPFYTTKEHGKGTGLGLSTVYGIVERNRGWIEAMSVPDAGTTFRIYLPTVLSEEAPTHPTPPSSLRGGSETVLLVEDEELVRSLTARVLREQGYNVIEAAGGAAALRLAREHHGEIALVLTDVIMPGMSGFELGERLRAHEPELPVIFMSGHTDPTVTEHGVAPESDVFLAKPFAPTTLLGKIRDVLDARRRTP